MFLSSSESHYLLYFTDGKPEEKYHLSSIHCLAVYLSIYLVVYLSIYLITLPKVDLISFVLKIVNIETKR